MHLSQLYVYREYPAFIFTNFLHPDKFYDFARSLDVEKTENKQKIIHSINAHLIILK